METTVENLLCPHKNFAAKFEIVRLTDTGRYMAEVAIQCADCGLPFHFLGMPAGLHPAEPMVNPDATEARLPIAPGRGGIFLLDKEETP